MITLPRQTREVVPRPTREVVPRHLLPTGARVVAPTDCYTAVRALLAHGQQLGRWSVELVDVADTAAVTAAAGRADLVWLESPTNPLLQVADLAAVCAAAKEAGAQVAVDNTFATPLLQRPLDLGADIVMHSATKFLGGHSDLLLGITVAAIPPWRPPCAAAAHSPAPLPAPSRSTWPCGESAPSPCVSTGSSAARRSWRSGSPSILPSPGSATQVWQTIRVTRSRRGRCEGSARSWRSTSPTQPPRTASATGYA
jgi:Cys/Met metabolism PLP-dependent enzyme